jgi:4-hydroxy-3-methylbut-2-enyl diphosphate reductase
VRLLVNSLRRRFPNADVRFIDTVCRPTKQRQHAAVELAQQCDVVIVIGGAHSNNTRELVETCSRYCEHVHHVQTADDLRPEWFEHANVAGITAGTSTPDDVIDRIEQTLHAIAVQRENSSHAKTHVESLNLGNSTNSSPSPPRSGGEGRGEVVLRVQGETTFSHDS